MGEILPASVTALEGALDGLLAVDWVALSGAELLDALRALERQRNRLAAVDARLLAEIQGRGLALDHGLRDTATLVSRLLRVHPGRARARVRAANYVAAGQRLTGERTEPVLPAAAEALRHGDVSPEHLDVVIDTVEAIPPDLRRSTREGEVDLQLVIEHALVDHGRHLDPRELARTAAVITARLDPDGVLESERVADHRRSLSLTTRRDGTGRLRGELTAEASAVWTTVLDALSKPVPVEGDRDTRTSTQRRHDALLDAGNRLLRSDLPESGGAPVTLLLTLAADQLLDADLGSPDTSAATREAAAIGGVTATGRAAATAASTAAGTGTAGSAVFAVTEHGELLAGPTALRMADEAVVTLCRLNADGGVVSYGRTRRLASSGMRRALAARDRGCSFPGCSAPPSWCQAHHVVPWRRGGPTALGNLALLCGYHHREFEARGWRCRMIRGAPHWIQPEWLDPDQVPRRNTANHVHPQFVASG